MIAPALTSQTLARSNHAPDLVRTDAERIRSALHFLDPHDRLTWVKMAFAIKSEMGDDGFDIWADWGSAHKRPAGEVKSTWKSAKPGGKIGLGSLIYRAIAAGWKDDTKYEKPSPEVIAQREARAAARKAQFESEEAAEHEAAANLAKQLWDEAEDCKSHPYLERKGVSSHGLKYGPFEIERTDLNTGEVTKVRMKALLVPLYDRQQNLWSVQAISAKPGGAKLTLQGSKKSGNFFAFGKPQSVNGRKVFILGEGYATCASIFEDTGHMVLMCVDASNMLSVARQIRERDPNATIVIAGDNDIWNRKADGTPQNPGRLAAEKAANAVDGIVALPPFTEANATGTDAKGNPTGPKDFNDWYAVNGTYSVKEVIDAALQAELLEPAQEVNPARVLLVPSYDEALGVDHSYQCLVKLDAEVAKLNGANTKLSVPMIVPYEDAQIESATELVRKMFPDAAIAILAAPGDEAEAQRVADQYDATAGLPSANGQWRGWGEHMLDLLFAHIDAAASEDQATQEAAKQALEQAQVVRVQSESIENALPKAEASPAVKKVNTSQALDHDPVEPAITTAVVSEYEVPAEYAPPDLLAVPQRIDAIEHSDDDLAERFVECAPNFRWSPGLGWMVDNGVTWSRDEALHRYDRARQVCRAIAAGCAAKAEGEAKRISSAKTVNATLTLAQSDRRMMVPTCEWDADSLLLNTPSGIVDLRTGKLRPRGIEYVTQSVIVAPDFEASCPRWHHFLQQVFLDDDTMIEFMQRSMGYWLSGSVREQVIHFLHGQGSNGKSVMSDLIKKIVGSYGVKLTATALMQSKGERHPTELAQLRGKRLALSSEVGENDYFNEALLKELTGDATLSARFMRGDFFEFQMTQKHVIVGNFKPRLRGGDPAIARRMLLVPFSASFHGSKKDPELSAKLQAEAPAILAWMIQGAVKWHAEGLAIPDSVRDASAEYMADHDDVAQWMAECCVRDGEAKASDLYASFSVWKKARGENAPSQTAWGSRLAALPGISKRRSGGIKYSGIRLNDSQMSAFQAGSYADIRG